LTWTSNEIAKVSFNWAKQYELSLLGVQHTSHLTDTHVALEGTWVNLSIDGAMARDNGNASTSGIIIIRRIQRIMRAEGQWRIRYIPRKCNLVTDYLVKLSLTLGSNLQVFNITPIEVSELLQRDKTNDFFAQFNLM
ncbi:hypothetical protein Golob_018202, partial [Gossypium lobatum]|nr:hypothetical protein [Gossypium lobatum]